MHRYALSHLPDDSLLRSLAALVARDRSLTADLLAHIAEVDARKLYLPAAYPSMFAYCVGELRLSEDAAGRRIQAARAARRFPEIFEAVADGRLHLTAVGLIAPHLTPGNVGELISLATGRKKSELEERLADRFPRDTAPGSPGEDSLFSQPLTSVEHALAHVDSYLAPAGDPRGEAGAGVESTGSLATADAWIAAGHSVPGGTTPGGSGTCCSMGGMASGSAAIGSRASGAPPCRRAKLTPLGGDQFALEVVIPGATRDRLRYAGELLGHAVAPGDLATVLDRALEALVARLEKRKFAATSKSRDRAAAAGSQGASADTSRTPMAGKPDGAAASGSRGTSAEASRPAPITSPRRDSNANPDPRVVPAHVKRAVWRRDEGRCTFTSAGGRRCESRRGLEFDHVTPVARGGEASVANLRLRCRAHNQYEAERVFGAEFIHGKRESSRQPQPRGPGLSEATPRSEATRRSEATLRPEATRQPDATHRSQATRRPEDSLRSQATRRARAATPRPGRCERLHPATHDAERARAAEEVVPWLEALGFGTREARSAAWDRGSEPGARLEARVRAALASLAPEARRTSAVATSRLPAIASDVRDLPAA